MPRRHQLRGPFGQMLMEEMAKAKLKAEDEKNIFRHMLEQAHERSLKERHELRRDAQAKIESSSSRIRAKKARIAELEKELGGWKAKFEEALGRLRGMDAGAASEVEEAIVLQDSKEAAKAEDGGFRPDAVVSSAPVVTVKQERCTTPPVVASMDVQQQVTPSPR